MSIDLHKSLNPRTDTADANQDECWALAKPQRGQWTPCSSRARIVIITRGLTYTKIAEQLLANGIPCSEFNVANVVRGFTKRPDIREGIARLVNMSVEALWPERQAS